MLIVNSWQLRCILDIILPPRPNSRIVISNNTNIRVWVPNSGVSGFRGLVHEDGCIALAPITMSGSPEVTIQEPTSQKRESDAREMPRGSVSEGAFLVGETALHSSHTKGRGEGASTSKQRAVTITLNRESVLLVSGRCIIDIPERTEISCAVFAIWREPI
jgi:hypothetical protein